MRPAPLPGARPNPPSHARGLSLRLSACEADGGAARQGGQAGQSLLAPGSPWAGGICRLHVGRDGLGPSRELRWSATGPLGGPPPLCTQPGHAWHGGVAGVCSQEAGPAPCRACRWLRRTDGPAARAPRAVEGGPSGVPSSLSPPSQEGRRPHTLPMPLSQPPFERRLGAPRHLSSPLPRHPQATGSPSAAWGPLLQAALPGCAPALCPNPRLRALGGLGEGTHPCFGEELECQRSDVLLQPLPAKGSLWPAASPPLWGS